MEILDRVDLNKLRLQMIMEGTIALEEEDAELKSARIGDVKAPAKMRNDRCARFSIS